MAKLELREGLAGLDMWSALDSNAVTTACGRVFHLGSSLSGVVDMSPACSQVSTSLIPGSTSQWNET